MIIIKMLKRKEKRMDENSEETLKKKLRQVQRKRDYLIQEYRKRMDNVEALQK